MLRNKVQNLEWESKQFSNIDVISLTETSLGPEINTGELAIEGYELLRNDRSEICIKIKSKKRKIGCTINMNDKLKKNLRVPTTFAFV